MTPRRRPGGRPLERLSVAGALVAAVAGCAPAPAPRTTSGPQAPPVPVTPELLVTFADAPGSGSVLAGPRSTGSAPVRVVVDTVGGGRVVAASGPDGLAGRFPTADGRTGGRAALVVVPTGPDLLSPGAADFSFGADVALDAVSETGTGDRADDGDNGDNVVQRGLFADPAQYKLQLDHGRPSCRVAGSSGEAVVRAEVGVVPTRWYRLVCTRQGSSLRIDVRAREGAGWGRVHSRTVWCPAGEVAFGSDPTVVVPLSVGAKVDAHGQVVTSSSDQLDGVVDNVFVDVLPATGPDVAGGDR